MAALFQLRSVPLEVWHLIYRHLSVNDLLQLSRVNKQVNRDLLPILYCNVHLFRQECIEMLVQTLVSRRDDGVGHLVRRVYLYEICRLPFAQYLAKLVPLTPNLLSIDHAQGTRANTYGVRFEKGCLWPNMINIAHWQRFHTLDLLSLRLKTLVCSHATIVALEQQQLPFLNQLTVYNDNIGRVSCPDGYSVTRFLENIACLAPALIHLDFNGTFPSQLNEQPAVDLALIQPASTVRSLRIRLLRLDLAFASYFHAKYPNLASLSVETKKANETAQHAVNVAAADLAPLLAHLKSLELHVVGRTPFDKLVTAMLDNLSDVSGASFLQPLTSLLLDTHFNPSAFPALNSIGDQLVSLTLTLTPNTIDLSRWLDIAGYHRDDTEYPPLPVLRKLCLHGKNRETRMSKEAAIVPLNRLLARFPGLTHLALVKRLKITSDSTNNAPLPPHYSLKGLLIDECTIESIKVLSDVFTGCTALVDVALLHFLVVSCQNNTRGIIIDTRDRDYRRVCVVGGRIKEHSSDSHNFPCPMRMKLPQTSSVLLAPEPVGIILWCRSVIRHARRLLSDHMSLEAPFSFDFIRVLDDD
ncbi:hypothetical protein BC940DRAFT_301443, partial [Gongronella butleri]